MPWNEKAVLSLSRTGRESEEKHPKVPQQALHEKILWKVLIAQKVES